MAENYSSVDGAQIRPDGSGLRIAVVVSDFNSEITIQLLEDCLSELELCHVAEDDVVIVHVPGAFEIPVAAQSALEQGDIDAVVCLGCVIRGETSHYDFICNSLATALQQVALKHSRPVLTGVLTTENIEQARQRAGDAKGPKGRQVADAALAMCRTLSHLRD